MTDSHQKNEFRSEGDSTATLEPIDRASDPGLLDELAKKLNAAPIKSETVDFERMQQLETRLADREQLVSILTDRLEQAADELDRIKRSGGVHSGSTADSADTASLLAGHSEVTEKLDRFVDAWEERYEGPALRRMEAGIDELRERLEQAVLHGNFSGGDSSVSGYSGLGDSSSLVADHDEETLNSTLNSNSELPEDHEDNLVTRRPLDVPVRLVLFSTDDMPEDLDVPLPEPIDEDEASELVLRKAVTDRDTYVRWLCQQMRNVTGRLEGWLKELQTESDDATLHKRVDEIEQLIHEQLRIAEIDVSIERARLSRDQAKLQDQTDQLNREREQLAKALNPSDSSDDTPMLRRWKKFITNQDS
jgi:hypothetical protein